MAVRVGGRRNGGYARSIKKKEGGDQGVRLVFARSAKSFAGLTDVPSSPGSSNSTSSKPIPSSRSKSEECVLINTWRPRRLWIRANI